MSQRYFFVLNAFILLISAFPTWAGLYTHLNSGNLVGVYVGNDSETAVKDKIDECVKLYGKIDEGFDEDQYVSSLSIDEITLTLDRYDMDGEFKYLSGTWTTTENICFYVLKASDWWALYDVMGDDGLGASSGTWCVDDIANEATRLHSLSHFSAYQCCDKPTVPAPAAIGLVMMGLGGVGAMKGRRHS